jgi:hypothetical protein
MKLEGIVFSIIGGANFPLIFVWTNITSLEQPGFSFRGEHT